MSETTEAMSVADMKKELERLRQSNRDKYGAIVRERGAVDPVSVLSLRLETFFDTFISDEDRIAYEMNFETRMNGQLNEVLSQMRQAQIMAGTQSINPSGLVIPGK